MEAVPDRSFGFKVTRSRIRIRVLYALTSEQEVSCTVGGGHEFFIFGQPIQKNLSSIEC